MNDILLQIGLVLFFLLSPILIIYATEKSSILNKIGAVLLSYALGVFIGNINVIQQIPSYALIQEIFTSATVPLALPLLLFSLDIKRWAGMAGKSMLSLVSGLTGVVIAVVLGFFIFKDDVNNSWQVGGMLVGVYSGGTPNLASIQTALNVDADTYLMINSLDIVVSTIYLFILMSFGKNILRRILPKYRGNTASNMDNTDAFDESAYHELAKKKNRSHILKSLGLSVLIVLISAALSFLITGKISMLVIILSMTTLGILFSFNSKVKQLKYSFQLGMYLILVFCVVVASMADINTLGSMAGPLFLYLLFVVFVALFIHILLAKVFKIDADTIIVSSTALICSPPFVPVMAGVLKNKEVIVSGLAVGIVGYAIGNYLGISIAYLLQLL